MQTLQNILISFLLVTGIVLGFYLIFGVRKIVKFIERAEKDIMPTIKDFRAIMGKVDALVKKSEQHIENIQTVVKAAEAVKAGLSGLTNSSVKSLRGFLAGAKGFLKALKTKEGGDMGGEQQ